MGIGYVLLSILFLLYVGNKISINVVRAAQDDSKDSISKFIIIITIKIERFISLSNIQKFNNERLELN